MKLLSLNVEGHLHLSRWLPRVVEIAPDVLCLQEVLRSDLVTIEHLLGMQSIFCTNAYIDAGTFGAPQDDEWGIAIFSRTQCRNPRQFRYWGEATLATREPETGAHHVLLATVPVEGIDISIATTHFVWSMGGAYTVYQALALDRLLQWLPRTPLIVCGDFNAPRDGEAFRRLHQRYASALPTDVSTTLDPGIHRCPELRLVVDHCFFSNEHYACKSCEALFGLSDHAGILAEIAPNRLSSTPPRREARWQPSRSSEQLEA